MLITFKILKKVSRIMLATAASLQAIEYIKEQRLKQVIYKQIKLALMPAVKRTRNLLILQVEHDEFILYFLHVYGFAIPAQNAKCKNKMPVMIMGV